MIRRATPADLPAIFAIRDTTGDDRLSNPASLSETLARRLLTAGAMWVWQGPDGPIAGFVAADSGEGSIASLLVASGERNRGIGRALLATACDALRSAGHTAATLVIEPGTPAERHYRASGWTVVRQNDNGDLVLQKNLGIGGMPPP